MALSAMLAALCYVTMLPLVGFYNVFLTLFICFAAGVLVGPGWGFLTGVLGMFLCSYFNPLGAALPPIMLAQMLGAGISGLLGGLARRWAVSSRVNAVSLVAAGAFGLLTALIYHLLVDITDAWLWGPFWVRLQVGLASSLVTIISNIVIFIILFPVLKVVNGVLYGRR